MLITLVHCHFKNWISGHFVRDYWLILNSADIAHHLIVRAKWWRASSSHVQASSVDRFNVHSFEINFFQFIMQWTEFRWTLRFHWAKFLQLFVLERRRSFLFLLSHQVWIYSELVWYLYILSCFLDNFILLRVYLIHHLLLLFKELEILIKFYFPLAAGTWILERRWLIDIW